MKKARIILLLIASICVTGNIYAEGMQFLKIPVFARAEGMGGAFTAIASGPDAIYYNPAGLALEEQEKHYVGAGYTVWLESIGKESVALILPSTLLSRTFIKAVSVDYLTVGGLKKYDSAGNKLGNMRYYDLALNVTLGAQLDKFLVGSNVKYLAEEISGYKGSGYGLDIGTLYVFEPFDFFSPRLQVGAVMSNIGNIYMDDQRINLPQTFRFGAGIIGGDEEDGLSFLAAPDLEKASDEKGTHLHMGGELNHGGYILRAGWKNTAKGSEYTLGIGVKSVPFEESDWNGQVLFDYAYTGGGYFENVIHRFDIGVLF